MYDCRAEDDEDTPSANEDLTCLVTVSRNESEPDSWPNALAAVSSAFRSHQLRGFRFEICDPVVFEEQTLDCVATDHALLATWPQLEEQIWTVIDELKFEWATLLIVRLEPARHDYEDSATIVIGAPRTTYRECMSLRKSVSHLLQGLMHNPNVAIKVTAISCPLK